jgi:phospholipid/cholesterol/gamma-HCH transport system substrate-binding protein
MARRTAARDSKGMAPVTAGAILVAVLVLVSYFGFTKHIPFTHGFRLQAVFETSNNVRPGSPVRIAGVNVGKVKKVERAGTSDAAVVTMELDDKALPIHKDATMKIRPRIFLEGNFFVDLKPGSPSAPKLGDNDRIPMTQTSAPVQLDQVLTSLQYDARTDLQDVLRNYGQGLKQQPTAAQDSDQDPSVQGEDAAQALNQSLKYAGPAEKNVSIVNEAVLGTQPGDLPKLIKSFGVVAGALDRNDAALKDLVTNFNITTGAFAAEASNLQATIRLLAPTLRSANATFTSLNAAFPPTRAFAREILPGVRETPATIDVSYPWVAQTRKLLGPNELGGLAKQAQPTTAALARLTDASIKLLPQVDKVNRCLINVILPTGDIKINDGNLTSGVENYKEFWYTMVSLAGEGQNFDGNGNFVRFQVGGGSQTVSTGKTSLGGDPLFGNAVVKPIGTRPNFPGKRPPYKPNVECATQQIPNLNGAATGGVEQTVRSQSGPSDLRAAGSQVPEQSAASPGASSGSGSPTLADQLAQRLNPFAKLDGDKAAQAPAQEGKQP